MQTTQIGNRGEQLAAEELQRKGYEIISRNWKTKWAEIDIVALRGQVLYFVEVKFRNTTSQGDGFDYITHNKLAHMTRAAELYVLVHAWSGPYELLGAAVNGRDESVQLREIA